MTLYWTKIVHEFAKLVQCIAIESKFILLAMACICTHNKPGTTHNNSIACRAKNEVPCPFSRATATKIDPMTTPKIPSPFPAN